jgi:hypothetical protein
VCLGEILPSGKFITWEVTVKFIQWLKKPTITNTVMFNRLWWFGHVQRMEENRIFKKVIYI